MNKNLDCTHFAKCSGCEISTDVDNPPILKEAIEYFANHGIKDLKIITGNPLFWRCRAKLAVRGTSENPKIGLYKKRTHEVLDIPFCKVHHPNINKAIQLIKQFITLKKIEPYNEQTGNGLLRYLQLVVERKSGKIQVTFIINADDEKDLDRWFLENPEIWHSVWLNFNKSKTNTIFGERWKQIKGEPLIIENFGNTVSYFHPASFAQANLNLFEKMLTSIEASVPQHSKGVEYYAGVGVIGLKIVSKCDSIVCSEITAQAEECFNKAKEKLESHLAEKISFESGLSEKQLHLLENKDLVIVDPPRKGADLTLLKAIVSSPTLKTFLYISCGFKAFQRDCDFILATSAWKIEKIELYLFFPGSNHLEILSVFTKT